MHWYVLPARVFDTTQVQDLCPRRCHLEHLLITDVRNATGAGHDPRVGGEHSVRIGVDLAIVGTQGCGERDRGRVGCPAAQGGDVLCVLGDALEAGDDHDVVLVKGLGDPAGGDVDDAGVAVSSGGDDPGLGTG